MDLMKLENLKLLIAAGNPIISISTPDEPRAVRVVHEVAQAIGLPVLVWSLTEGLRACGLDQVLVEAGKPAAALSYVKDSAQPAIYLFKDLGQHAKEPQILPLPPRSLFLARLAALDDHPPGRHRAADGDAKDEPAFRNRLARRRGNPGHRPQDLPGGPAAEPAEGGIASQQDGTGTGRTDLAWT